MVAAQVQGDRARPRAFDGVRRRGRSEPHDVETRLVALARAGAPLRRSLAVIAGRLVASRAWERLGFARLGDYARERVGLSARQLQDLAHVDAALGKLPRIEAAFAAGALTWTKARLLCRVATPEDESHWLAVAQRRTARALAQEVRALDTSALDPGGVETDEEGAVEEARETIVLHVTPPVRAKWSRAKELARRRAGEKLPAWAVAELVAAEVFSAIPLDEIAAGTLEEPANGCARYGCEEGWAAYRPANGCAVDACEEGATARPPENGCASEEASGLGEDPTPWFGASPRAAPFLRSLVDGLADADAFELDRRLRRAVRLEQRLEAELGPWLLELAGRGLYRLYDCPSLDVFAREWLGMSPRKAQALLRLERACLLCPALREAWRTGRLSWARAHVLVPLLLLEGSEPWHAAWVARAERVTVRRLEDDVDRAIGTRVYDPEAEPERREDPHRGAQAADPTRPTAPPPPTRRLALQLPRDVARLFLAVLATARRRIERRTGRPSHEPEAFEAMLDHALVAWESPHGKVPREHRVYARDGWRCTVPGCSSYRSLHDHHIVFRSQGGCDDLANRTTMCAWHHQRGVHAGLVRCRGHAPERLRFELGLRPGRPPLAAYRSGDVVESSGPA